MSAENGTKPQFCEVSKAAPAFSKNELVDVSKIYRMRPILTHYNDVIPRLRGRLRGRIRCVLSQCVNAFVCGVVIMS